MKGRESGMPAKELWEQFFKPEAILRVMQIDGRVNDLAEFGCGYGTFTIPAARMIHGTVYAMDIEPEMIKLTEAAARAATLTNVDARLRDFMADGTGLAGDSVDYVMLFNILHIEQPEVLLREARRILQPQGRLGIMHWTYDPATPRGPSMTIRPPPEQCVAWATQAGFVAPTHYELKPYHYGIVMRKEDGT